MYDNSIHRDIVKSETEYRLSRVHDELAGRRRRKKLVRRGEAGETGWTTVR